MKVISFLMTIFIIVILILMQMGCTKDNVNASSNHLNQWDTCPNLVAKDVDFRLGIWEQIPVKMPSLAKINFINDSIFEHFTLGDTWHYDVKYRFRDCNTFVYDQYWIQPHLPYLLYEEIYSTRYNISTKEWTLLVSLDKISIDTLNFKKQ